MCGISGEARPRQSGGQGTRLFRPEYIEELRAAPNEHRTPVGYNKLWQLGLLELWLQTHGIS